MRNIFDQYKQPENRLTHSLASVLNQDRKLLKSFLSAFGPKSVPAISSLQVIEQGLPGKVELDEDETLSRGLPDMLVFNDQGWAFVIESKIDDALTKDQLKRHFRTVQKCGFDNLHGLSICVEKPAFEYEGWNMIAWKEVYSWAHKHKSTSQWAGFLIDYFNVAEAKMVNEAYLKDGTITEFSGVSFDPFSYLEGKRILRLLTKKIRGNKSFIREMLLDPETGRSAITNQGSLWDFVSFIPPEGKEKAFQQYPHCTVGINEDKADAMITFPHGMSPTLRKALHGGNLEEFEERLCQACDALTKSLKGYKSYKPMVRIMQRRYQTQRSVPMMDGRVEFDLRVLRGEKKPHFGPSIKRQPQWAELAYELLSNKRSNIQFQIGVEIYYNQFDELDHKEADKFFVDSFTALKKFSSYVTK